MIQLEDIGQLSSRRSQLHRRGAISDAIPSQVEILRCLERAVRTWSFIIIAVIPLLICGCSSLRKDVPSIREALLKKTPPGSQYEAVWHYAERKGWHPSSQKPDLEDVTIGTRWIRARLGRYWHHSGWYTKGISCYYVVDAYWCFDANDRLIDILVSKEVGAPFAELIQKPQADLYCSSRLGGL